MRWTQVVLPAIALALPRVAATASYGRPQLTLCESYMQAAAEVSIGKWGKIRKCPHNCAQGSTIFLVEHKGVLEQGQEDEFVGPSVYVNYFVWAKPK